MISIKYRADIDGLRAVAVLGVVIYHAFPWLIPGGFIGVDIFFVISGYLISGILYKGLKANGGDGNFSPFSFREFYARRIRRLFPALITMLVLTMAYGWLILLPDEFQQLGKHVAAGTLFIQNFVFWQESGYFDTAASLKPLLHLWSLAVEEQFYIFFPPLLLLIWKRKWPLVIILGVLLIASLILNLVMSVQDRVPAFFLTPYRAWEFLGGSLLAWWHYDRGHEEDVPFYRAALSWGGALLLILGMAFIHKSDPYPGWRAILPVAGTLLLMEGGRGAWVNRKILSNPAVVWIGLISYPLYLFHWPALSFVHIVKGENPKPGYILMALLMSLALTVLTYYFIEKKIRHNKSKWVLPVLVGAFILTGLIGFLIANGLIPAAVPPKIQKLSAALSDKDWTKGLEVLFSKKTLLMNKAGGDGPKTLFFGDSNTQMYGPRITKLLSENKGQTRGAIFLTCGGVPPIPNVTVENRSDECRGLIEKFNEVISSDSTIDRVVIAALWQGYFKAASTYQYKDYPMGERAGRDAALHELGLMIRGLVSRGKTVTLVLSVPSGSKLEPRGWYGRTFYGVYDVKTPRRLKSAEFLQHCGEMLKSLAEIAKANGATVIDPMDSLTSDGFCIGENDDGPIRHDACHLRSGFVREHVKYLDDTVAP